MGHQERCFAMVVVTELIEQEFAALRRWIDLRKETIDRCRNCPMPPANILKQISVTGDEVLHRLGKINRLVTGREATFASPVNGSDWVSSVGGANAEMTSVRKSEFHPGT